MTDYVPIPRSPEPEALHRRQKHATGEKDCHAAVAALIFAGKMIVISRKRKKNRLLLCIFTTFHLYFS
jgi:hypothetical protein